MTEVIGTNYFIIPYRKVTNIFIVSNILKFLNHRMRMREIYNK